MVARLLRILLLAVRLFWSMLFRRRSLVSKVHLRVLVLLSLVIWLSVLLLLLRLLLIGRMLTRLLSRLKILVKLRLVLMRMRPRLLRLSVVSERTIPVFSPEGS